MQCKTVHQTFFRNSIFNENGFKSNSRETIHVGGFFSLVICPVFPLFITNNNNKEKQNKIREGS